ncbi:unnamed protein product [Peniophora sp. CBMAI 1063]|nr:unnamed protein product [Peniophora sp. CBMAI 1063]
MNHDAPFRRSRIPLPHPIDPDCTFEEAMRTVMREDNWATAVQQAEPFVPVKPDEILRPGVVDPFRNLNQALSALPSPSIDLDLSLSPFDPRIVKLASYPHTLTKELRDAEEFRRLWTLLLDAPSDFIQVWRIFLVEDDPRRNYMLTLASDHASKVDLRRTWERLILGGLCDLYPTLFYRVHSPASLLSILIIGRGVLEWASWDPMTTQRAATTTKFLQQLNEFWKIMWVNIPLFRDDTPFDKKAHRLKCEPLSLRDALQNMIAAYLSITETEGLRGNWVPEQDSCKTLCRILFFLWHSPPGSETTIIHKHFVFNMLNTLFDPSCPFTCLAPNDRNDFMDEEVVAGFGANRFLCRVATNLDNPPTVFKYDSYVGNTLMSIINDVGCIIERPAFRPHLASSGILRAIRDFADVPRKHGLVTSADDLWGLFDNVLRVLDLVLRSAAISQAAKPLLRDCDVFGLLAEASVHFANAPSTEPGHSSITHVLSFYVLIAGGVQAQSGREQLHELLLQSIRPVWYRTIHHLGRIQRRDTSIAKKCLKLISVWMKLGDILALEEDAEKKEYERSMKREAQMCAWAACQYHKMPSGSPTRACAGCGEARYCSRPCQQSDWKEGGHKKRCKRIKPEAHTSRKGRQTV